MDDDRLTSCSSVPCFFFLSSSHTDLGAHASPVHVLLAENPTHAFTALPMQILRVHPVAHDAGTVAMRWTADAPVVVDISGELVGQFAIGDEVRILGWLTLCPRFKKRGGGIGGGAGAGGARSLELPSEAARTFLVQANNVVRTWSELRTVQDGQRRDERRTGGSLVVACRFSGCRPFSVSPPADVFLAHVRRLLGQVRRDLFPEDKYIHHARGAWTQEESKGTQRMAGGGECMLIGVPFFFLSSPLLSFFSRPSPLQSPIGC